MAHQDDPDNDTCPICHTKRYLNRSMRFLINPECYHKMCEGCVDRIFSHGPAPCPVAGCSKTLRRQRFRLPTFSDLALEREIDIRKTVATVFNRREEEFEDLRSWNDYLNDVEDVTFNLINGIDVEATTRKLDKYAEANRQSISDNRKLEMVEVAEMKARVVEQEEFSRRLREVANDEAERERAERESVRRRIIDGLAGGGDARGIVKEGEKALNKRPGQSRRLVGGDGNAGGDGSGGFMIHGLKRQSARVDEEEMGYDPFAGLTELKEYLTLPDELDLWDEYLGKTRSDTKIVASGYRVEEFYERALTEAFSGLGVFVEEEMSRKDAKRKRRRENRADHV